MKGEKKLRFILLENQLYFYLMIELRIHSVLGSYPLPHVGSKNLTTPAHLILSPRPTPRRKEWPRTNKEGPNGPETSPRTIVSSANPDPSREERPVINDSLLERPKKKNKYYRTATGAWCRNSSRRNYHLRIKCPQLTF